jgi:branched-chain amino acid aminotransferase
VICIDGVFSATENLQVTQDNRLVRYGDGVFETMKWVPGKVLFFEDHYFRLMSSMRVLRMEIPMHFSPEYLEETIAKFLTSLDLFEKAARIRLTVYRKDGGLYAPVNNNISWFMTAAPLEQQDFPVWHEGVVLDLYKDFSKTPELLSTLKTCNAMLYTLAGNHARENGFDDVMILNTLKEVTDTVSSNIFIVKGDALLTPPLSTGALKGIMRKQVMQNASDLGLSLQETAFSPFELQHADEVWLTNVISGVKWVRQYRRKTFVGHKAQQMQQLLNRLSKI